MLADRITYSFDVSDQPYGYRRVHADLVAEGTHASPELVRKIMPDNAMIACRPRPFRITTDADQQRAAAIPDRVQRDFTADQPGVTFVCDITYIHP